MSPTNWAGRCDAKCVYCWIRSNDDIEYEGKGSPWTKRSFEIISHLKEKNAIINNAQAFLSEGEITISPKKDMIYEALSGYRIAALTNGFRFDQKLAQGISNGGRVTISLDAGTRETFYAVKGFDSFDQFLQNIRDYKKYGNVELKYVLMAGVNDNEEDIENAFAFIKEINPVCFTLSYDKLIMGRRSAFYGFMRFIVLAKEHGVPIALSGKDSLIKFSDTYEYSIQCLSKSGDYYRKKRDFLADHFRKNFDVKTYANDYDAHRRFVFKHQIYELVKCFTPQTRFCIVGKKVSGALICEAVNEATGRKAIHVYNVDKRASYVEHTDVYLFEFSRFAETAQENTKVFGDKLIVSIEEYMYCFGTPTDYLKTIKNADRYLIDYANDTVASRQVQNTTLNEQQAQLQSLRQELQRVEEVNDNLNQTIKYLQTIEKSYDDLSKSKLGKLQVSYWNYRSSKKNK